MIRGVRIALFFVLLATTAGATISRDPDFAFRWNKFSSAIAVDSFVIATTHDGLAVYSRTGSGISLTQLTHVFLDVEPVSQHRFGSVLVVGSNVGELFFFSLSGLPNLEQLGQIDLGVSFNDLSLRGNDLYVCRGFDGLFRYRLSNFRSATVLDSSLIGIHYRQMEITGDTLLALDDFNGIMFYHITDTAFPDFESYGYLPFPATSFVKQDSVLVLTVDSNRVFVGKLRPSGLAVTDSITLLTTPARSFSAGQTVLLLDSSGTFLEQVDPIHRREGLSQLDLLPDTSLNCDVTMIGTHPYVLFPLREGGIGFCALDSLWGGIVRPSLGLLPEGSITTLAMLQGKLFVGADHNPMDEFQISSGGEPIYERTLYSGLDQVSSADVVGDSLFISYPQIRRSVVLQVTPDSNVYSGAFYLDTMKYNRLRFNPTKIDTLRSAFTIGPSKVGIYTVTDSGYISDAGSFDVIGRIRDVEFVDSVVAITTGKGVWLFRVYDDFTVEYRSSLDLGAECFQMLRYGPDLAVFAGSTMLRVQVTDPFHPVVDTVIQLPWSVAAACPVGRLIYAVGQDGICVIDTSGSNPVLLDKGGRGGYLIASQNGIVAISDSNTVMVYDLTRYPTPVRQHPNPLPSGFALGQNYPNPFNPNTAISYTLPSRSTVELAIYNLLGQRVTTLVNKEQAAGQYQVTWDGHNEAGRAVATGMYFYLLRAGQFSASKKMILLK
jgi:hypothetical protein